MNGPDSVAVIVVNHNSGDYLKACLAGVNAQTRQPDRVIVVDNASSDESVDKARPILPEAQWILLDTNTGFAAANNLTVKQASDCRWVALLNPDTVPDSDWLETVLTAAASHPDFSFFGSHLVHYDDPERLDGTGDVYHVCGLAWRRDHGRRTKRCRRESSEVFSPCAAAALYDREAFLSAGGFDERFFAYFEDTDLAFRLRLNGHCCLYVAEARVRHAGWGSSEPGSAFSIYHAHRNLVWTFVQNMPDQLFWKYLPAHFALNLFSVLWFALKGKPGVILKAKWDAWRGLRDALKKRRVIQKHIAVDPEALEQVMNRNWLEPFRVFLRRRR
ncbi:Predicted glycosyltransferase [Nitrospina gracilis 3/211]|uniref:Predicted glycosyltransferase n=1 Tax=Nitrospina gracilis (strain 3/211) TaxID=1266370 RepID=M1YWD2_NITG3|nr:MULTISPECIES: glycosyltransferase family 2 protein [Nitrospina]MCF8722835.1 GT2 family glycosyltransferase [Nitrospina sp. Nb-3]CCQ89793.1 Predicted glycosyltransferase [Nitrospina gracilis 3/211]